MNFTCCSGVKQGVLQPEETLVKSSLISVQLAVRRPHSPVLDVLPVECRQPTYKPRLSQVSGRSEELDVDQKVLLCPDNQRVSQMLGTERISTNETGQYCIVILYSLIADENLQCSGSSLADVSKFGHLYQIRPMSL